MFHRWRCGNPLRDGWWSSPKRLKPYPIVLVGPLRVADDGGMG